MSNLFEKMHKRRSLLSLLSAGMLSIPRTTMIASALILSMGALASETTDPVQAAFDNATTTAATATADIQAARVAYDAALAANQEADAAQHDNETYLTLLAEAKAANADAVAAGAKASASDLAAFAASSAAVTAATDAAATSTTKANADYKEASKASEEVLATEKVAAARQNADDAKSLAANKAASATSKAAEASTAAATAEASAKRAIDVGTADANDPDLPLLAAAAFTDSDTAATVAAASQDAARASQTAAADYAAKAAGFLSAVKEATTPTAPAKTTDPADTKDAADEKATTDPVDTKPTTGNSATSDTANSESSDSTAQICPTGDNTTALLDTAPPKSKVAGPKCKSWKTIPEIKVTKIIFEDPVFGKINLSIPVSTLNEPWINRDRIEEIISRQINYNNNYGNSPSSQPDIVVKKAVENTTAAIVVVAGAWRLPWKEATAHDFNKCISNPSCYRAGLIAN